MNYCSSYQPHPVPRTWDWLDPEIRMAVKSGLLLPTDFSGSLCLHLFPFRTVITSAIGRTLSKPPSQPDLTAYLPPRLGLFGCSQLERIGLLSPPSPPWFFLGSALLPPFPPRSSKQFGVVPHETGRSTSAQRALSLPVTNELACRSPSVKRWLRFAYYLSCSPADLMDWDEMEPLITLPRLRPELVLKADWQEAAKT